LGFEKEKVHKVKQSLSNPYSTLVKASAQPKLALLFLSGQWANPSSQFLNLASLSFMALPLFTVWQNHAMSIIIKSRS